MEIGKTAVSLHGFNSRGASAYSVWMRCSRAALDVASSYQKDLDHRGSVSLTGALSRKTRTFEKTPCWNIMVENSSLQPTPRETLFVVDLIMMTMMV